MYLYIYVLIGIFTYMSITYMCIHSDREISSNTIKNVSLKCFTKFRDRDIVKRKIVKHLSN